MYLMILGLINLSGIFEGSQPVKSNCVKSILNFELSIYRSTSSKSETIDLSDIDGGEVEGVSSEKLRILLILSSALFKMEAVSILFL